ncbi:short-chain dehydrogenase [Mycobacterium kubicae]|uniref:SDR family oxidoreductase n=1 Tax=Mycobacterium kubicae TaxID=120959 RepID=A0AAX1JEV7_9MYCO|nr:SDR family oxidoreductase [Mycobacterium kubicae]MCV7095530.1 SDR family oxidoreductase [Mycobacterium kubicae]ORV94171.1 short-chain dehydrogenase [Mycobacterium kubicae]QNI11757.1 SDR family oxidoreductase [Mycobacterium kubicae]QPI39981.1 SDR family oxidoreductase [Mycobacterium kubicae]GFG64656.1 short-chain dehydrogenase [Mycobacterium kubicae]
MSLCNQIVLIIGGTSGIGLAVAAAVAERGATPVVASRRSSSVDRALGLLPAGARGATVDLADPASIERLAEWAGPVDHVVYTAGEPLETVPLASLTPDVIAAFYQTRFIGACSTVRVFGRRLAAGGSITLTSGSAAEQPDFGALPVSLCGAMNALTAALAVELAPVRVNSVAPGMVRSPLWRNMGEEDREAMFSDAAERIPLGRVADAEEVARAYLFCIEQTYSTGAVVKVDGGSVLV